MNLHGEVLGILRDTVTGEETQRFTATNHIQDSYLRRLATLDNLGTSDDLGSVLFISETNPGQQERTWSTTIPNCFGGTNISGTVNPELFIDDGPDYHLGQWLQRFNAPIADRTINIAGICTSCPTTGGSTSKAATVVWLSTPCIQTTTETLDLYYRVQLKFNPNWKTATADETQLTRYEAEILLHYLVKGQLPLFPSGFTSPYSTAISKMNTRKLDMGFLQGGIYQLYTTDKIDNNSADYFTRERTLKFGIIESLGALVGTIHAHYTALGFKLSNPGDTPIQSVFGHRSSSITPFYSAANSQLGLGTVAVNGDAWTNPDFPKYFTLDITATGINGVGTYQMKVRNHFGFDANTFKNLQAELPYASGYNGHYAGNFALCRDKLNSGDPAFETTFTAFPKIYYDKETFFLWKDSFCITNILSGEGVTFDNTTLVGADITPRFLATDICQIAVAANKDFYVACRNTGIYKFNAALDTLTYIGNTTTGLTNTAGCHGVCIGNAGRLWSYWNHTTTPTIYFSDDDGATWTATTFSDAFLDVNPDNVVSVQVDKNDVNGQLAVIYINDLVEANVITTYCKWWDNLTSIASDGPLLGKYLKNTNSLPITIAGLDHSYYYQDSILCSPNNSYWASSAYKSTPSDSVDRDPSYYTFGSNVFFARHLSDTLTDLAPKSPFTHFVKDAAGNDALIFLTTNGENSSESTYGSAIVIYSRDGTVEHARIHNSSSGSSPSGEYATVYYGDGVFLGVQWNSSINKTNHTYLSRMYLISAVHMNIAEVNTTPGLAAEVWPTYGWDGVNWVRGHAGHKTLHTAPEELIQGITVAWNDSAGGAQFLDSDHYTFGAFEGVWLDGSTTFDFTFQQMTKPSKTETDTESATLPVITKVSNLIIASQTQTDTDYQDILGCVAAAGGKFSSTGNSLQSNYDVGGRSLIPSIVGDAQSFLPNNTLLSNTEVNNVQGWLDFKAYFNDITHAEWYAGVSPVTVLGTALNFATIAYGFHFDSVTPGNGVGTGTLRVVESTVERAVVTNVPYDFNTLEFRIALLTNGSMLYMYTNGTTPWIELYRSPPGSVTIENLYFDCNFVGLSSYGFDEITRNSLDTSSPDYFMYLGNGVDSGLFSTDYYATLPNNVVISIDGYSTDAVNIGIDDLNSTLSGNSYSIFPRAGVIRFSAADAGKAVTARYITMTHS